MGHATKRQGARMIVDVQHLKLESFHTKLGAKFVSFAGYRMPSSSPKSVKGEHLQTRKAIGLFDVSHMGQIIIEGPQAAEALEKLVPAALQEMKPGQIRYSQLTLENGGILDDLMLTRWDKNSWGLVVNGACKFDDIKHLEQYLDASILMTHLEDLCLIAVQGPRARLALSSIMPEAADLVFMQSIRTTWNNIEIVLSCCGYTGEDGYEISIHKDHAETLAIKLTDLEEATWVGLGARNSLRLETGLCLYGNDLTRDTTPIEAGLIWSIQKRRRIDGGFLGAEVICKQIEIGVDRKRVGITPLDGRTPIRDHTLLKTEGGEIVGEITSGGFGPTHNGPIAMAYISHNVSAIETTLVAEVRGKALPCKVCDPGFVKQHYIRAL